MLMTMIIQADMYDDDTPLEYLMRTPVWGLCMILCMHRFCLDKRKENFLQIMYMLLCMGFHRFTGGM